MDCKPRKERSKTKDFIVISFWTSFFFQVAGICGKAAIQKDKLGIILEFWEDIRILGEYPRILEFWENIRILREYPRILEFWESEDTRGLQLRTKQCDYCLQLLIWDRGQNVQKWAMSGFSSTRWQNTHTSILSLNQWGSLDESHKQGQAVPWRNPGGRLKVLKLEFALVSAAAINQVSDSGNVLFFLRGMLWIFPRKIGRGVLKSAIYSILVWA